jgi:predicted RNA-binding Zn-ribbon protein involved in translation (DUF1610 family)
MRGPSQRDLEVTLTAFCYLIEWGTFGPLPSRRTVPGKTTCPHCGKVGLVRVEHVIHGGKSYNSFECTDCMHQWQALETGEHVPISDHPERPDHSRSRTGV